MQPIATRVVLGVLVAAPIMLIGCQGDRLPTAPMVPRTPDADVVEDAAISPWASVIDGEDGGALYRLLMPTSWNGDLLVIAHGYVDPLNPVALPDFMDFANRIGSEGFAVAFSSFSENGWAVKDGAQRTHALTEVFAQQFGSPNRVFVGGQSMGGLIALDLAERFPTQYAGVYSFCGATGGSTLRFRYMMDVRALFDVFYRKPDPEDPTRTIPILPGDALHLDRTAIANLETEIRQVARSAMLADDRGAQVIAKISRTPVPFAAGNRNQMINSIADQLFRHAREIDDIMARGHGASAIDNTRVTYTGAGIDRETLAFIDANVQRFSADKYAVHEAEKYYDPDGSLRIPLVSLRTTRDPALPAPLNDDAYLALLSPAQRNELVTVTTVNAFGHCSTTLDDVVKGFNTLVEKANTLSAANQAP